MATPPPKPSPDDNGVIQAQYGGLTLRAKGWSLILLIGAVCNVVATLYSAHALRVVFDQAHAQRSAEHQTIVNELARAACLYMLTPEERAQFRAGGKGGWSRWCWWIRDEPYEGRYPRGDHDDR